MDRCSKMMLKSIAAMINQCHFGKYKFYTLTIWQDGEKHFIKDVIDLHVSYLSELLNVIYLDGGNQKCIQIGDVKDIDEVNIKASNENIVKRFYRWHKNVIDLSLMMTMFSVLCCLIVFVWFLEWF